MIIQTGSYQEEILQAYREKSMIESGESGQRVALSRLCGMTTRLSLFAVLEWFITPVENCAVPKSVHKYSTQLDCEARSRHRG